ncbi:MAG: ribonuclease P protein component [Paracoccaceae bacterium]|jgi:ribonuclease P protein component
MDHGTQAKGQVAVTPPAVFNCELVKISKMAERRDFLRAASAKRQATAGFLLQARHRNDGDVALKVGFTCSKKIGNAATRNRAKRRLREVARAILPQLGHEGWDYVLVGRPQVTVARPFSDLCTDLTRALALLHTPSAP